jgi:nickel superoxide dismutase
MRSQMKMIFKMMGLMSLIFFKVTLFAHCQMPCGIYHDEIVFDQIDQYTETMFKGISVINQIKINNMHDQNDAVRWIVEKEKESNEIANLITVYFLQQKIKPGEPDTAQKLASAHRLLFFLVAIKQNTDLKFVKEFNEEWEKFKDMFHIEGYECKIEKLKFLKKENLSKKTQEKKAMNQDDHDHDHDHDHQH